MITLLSKTRTIYLAYTAIIFILTAPLFYLITKYFYAEDMIYIIESVQKGSGIPVLDYEEDLIEGMFIQILLVFIVISISFYFTIHLITKRLWQPFDDTLRQTELFNIAQDKLPNFTPTDVKEFARLNESLTKLMNRSQKTFKIQKEFTENASHELQTPLAVMRTKLDMLMQEELNERQMKYIADLDMLTMRMSHLNRNLLLLAKIDNAQYDTIEEIDIIDFVSSHLSLYKTLQNDVVINIHNRNKKSKIVIKANEILFECLFKNLIINAKRHSPQNSEVTITVKEKQLTISNHSTDNKALNKDTLFHRFGSTNTKKSGNGLGLAIVKAICDFHKWEIEYTFKEQNHNFTITFGK